MLIDTPFHVVEWPEIVVYPDDQQSGRLFYACAARPRLVRETSGEAAMSVMVYARRGTNPPEASGGQLMATVTLQLNADEQRGIEAALNGRLVYPDWIEAEVTLKGVAGLVVTGTPSMMGGNDCVLTASLPAAQASALAREWPHALGAAVVRYQCTARSVVAQSAAATTRSRTTVAGATVTRDSQVSASSRAARPLAIVAEGPLARDTESLTDRLQIVSF